MRTRTRSRLALILFGSCLTAALAACGGGTSAVPEDAPRPAAPPSAPPAPLVNEIPPAELPAVMKAHYRGLGLMERYEYREAADAFREVRRRAPGWIPGSINLAIALLNDTGTQAESEKKAGGSGNANFDEALTLLDAVIEREPENLHARYCRGLILEYLGQGNTAKAHADYTFVAERDPTDGHVWLRVGSTLTSPDDPDQPAGPAQAKELVEIYSKALDSNPYLVTALYKLQQAYSWARDRAKQAELLERWRKLNPKQMNNPAGPGDTAENFYGEAGKYAKILNPFPAPKAAADAPRAPKFEAAAPIKVTLPDGHRWACDGDFTGDAAPIGRARARSGAAAVVLDADGDRRADLFLAAAVVGPKGPRDVLLLNRGDGSFADASREWGLPDDRPSLVAAAADFDADRRVDLFLAAPSGNRLLANAGGKFRDVTQASGLTDTGALAVDARWLDLDQDGDLDLYVVQETTRAAALAGGDAEDAPKVTNAAYRNVGKPAGVTGRPQDNWAPIGTATEDFPATEGLSLAFAPWPEGDAIHGPPGHYHGIAALDLDDDRDLDLVLSGDAGPPVALLNDRLGAFHVETLDGLTAGPVSGVLVVDLDKDGRSDLVFARSGGQVEAWRNAVDRSTRPAKLGWTRWAADGVGWRQAVAADLDLDTWTDVVGLPDGGSEPKVDWSRNDGAKLSTRLIDHGPGTPEAMTLRGMLLANVAGDALPDLILLPDGAAPQVATNAGNGRRWIALDLGGRWKTSFDHMRTNPHGIGTRLTLEGQGLSVRLEHTTPNTGPGQSVAPIVLGLGDAPAVELLRLKWPDGTIQCELNQTADTELALAERNRKTGSCPVLFTWNGDRFVCLGDFLGGGGLGYLVAPGVYGQPDRDESVAIAPDQLKAVDGVFRVSVTEPMDEVAYLDRLELVAVDRPPGVSATPDERFAPEGPRPTGEVLAWRDRIDPVQATDLKGADLSKTLAAWDRDTADGFKRLKGWVGYAEEHGIVLDFGDRLSTLGSDDPLLLVLAGWVEYPYSQTNYAAATAGVTLTPPSVERLGEDGVWRVIVPHAGYPAGLPRMTTLDLTGKLNGPRCVIRLRTNMECYYDQAFLARRDRAAEAQVRRTTLGVARAVLSPRGYTREVSPDGKQPLLYDYDYVDPAPLALMAGTLTRHGDVAPLLRKDDDQLCLVGPGDEVRLEFEAKGLPPLPDGWTRSYVLKAVGYCKDADPLTATSDTVDPLPWKGMPEFPFATPAERPRDPAYEAYLKTYQTRPAGGR